MKIIYEIKSILDEKRIPVLKLSKESEIPAYHIYKWIDGKASPKEDDVRKLEQWIARNKEGRRDPDTSSAFTKVRAFILSEDSTPLKEGPPSGTIEDTADGPALIMDYIRAPFIGDMTGVVEVTGDAMIPTLVSGTRIAIQQLPNPRLFYPGEIYFLIDANLQGMVRRIYEGEKDAIVLTADNPDVKRYPSTRRQWKDIRAIYKVKADINKR